MTTATFTAALDVPTTLSLAELEDEISGDIVTQKVFSLMKKRSAFLGVVFEDQNTTAEDIFSEEDFVLAAKKKTAKLEYLWTINLLAGLTVISTLIIAILMRQYSTLNEAMIIITSLVSLVGTSIFLQITKKILK